MQRFALVLALVGAVFFFVGSAEALAALGSRDRLSCYGVAGPPTQRTSLVLKDAFRAERARVQRFARFGQLGIGS